MPYNVSPADVEARWRPLSDAESSVASVLLEDLGDELDLVRPTLSTFLLGLTTSSDPAVVTKGGLLERMIIKTLANAAKLALRNPDTLRSTTIGADGAIGVGYDNDAAALASTGAELTKDDLAAIDRATVAVGGDAPTSYGSVKLQAYPERYAVPDLSILPIP